MEHKSLNEKTVKLSETYKRSEVELISVLVSMKKNNSFLVLGFKNLWDYCIRQLGLSESQSGYLKRIIEVSVTVPELAKAIQQGELSVSQARRIVPVVSNENVTSWVKKANTLPQRELEREVAIVNPKSAVRETLKPVSAVRSKLSLGISKDFEDDLIRLCKLTGKSKEEMLALACKKYLSQIDPEQKAKRSFLRKTKRVRRIQIPGVRNAIPAKTKHEFVGRNGYQCSQCNEATHLNWHHKKPVARGGGNELENLELLCWAHHRMHHLSEGSSAVDYEIKSGHVIVTNKKPEGGYDIGGSSDSFH